MADIQVRRISAPAFRGWGDAGAVSCRAVPEPPTIQNDLFYVWFAEIMANQLPASQTVRQWSGCIYSVRSEWSALREQVAEADALDLDAGGQEVLAEDNTYIAEACATAAAAPDFTMTEEDRRSYQGLGNYSYDLSVDYDEE